MKKGSKSLPRGEVFTLLLQAQLSLLAFEAVAAGAAFRITTASIPHVNLSQRAVIPRAVVLTFRHPTANARVHFLYIFVHHNKKPPFLVSTV